MKFLVLLFSLIFSLGCAPIKQREQPKLVVLVSIDQMRGDYFDKIIKPINTDGGFVTLFNNGTVFTDAHHKHAVTTTAAGHATLATGFYPSHNGIVNNTVYNRDVKYSHYSILDSTVNFVGIENCELNKVSAKNLLKPTIGDIMKQQDSKSKSYSVALKDRASILMGGHLADRAFWFDAKSTQMVSTDYYSDPFPSWAKTFTSNNEMTKKDVEGWLFETPEKPEYTSPKDSFDREKGTFLPWFPHTIASMDTNRVQENHLGSYTWNTPFGDQYVLDFAKELINKQELGNDEHTDYLSIGLSAADVIGHHFGPHSLEVLDYYSKMNLYIDNFISYLDSSVGSENYLLVLTSDHGVAAMPEILATQGNDAQRIETLQFKSDIGQIDTSLMQTFGITNSTLVKIGYNGLEPNFVSLQAAGIDSLIYIDSLSSLLKKLDYVNEVYSFFDYSDSNCTKPYIELMRNSHRPEYEYFVKILGKENYLMSMRTCGTTHGSPYSYDTHVPVVFYGNGTKAKSVSTKISTVDIAPTVISHLYPEMEIESDGINLEID